jgi:hypothetical protein
LPFGYKRGLDRARGEMKVMGEALDRKLAKLAADYASPERYRQIETALAAQRVASWKTRKEKPPVFEGC